MTYNGWKNYETWNCKLWIDNEQSTYKFWRGNAKQLCRDRNEEETKEEQSRVACLILAGQLTQHTIDAAPQIEPSMYSDILHANLQAIDFFEIADSILEECQLNGYQGRNFNVHEGKCT